MQVTETLKPLLDSVRLEGQTELAPMLDQETQIVSRRPDDSDFTEEDRFVASIATLLQNVEDAEQGAFLAELQNLIAYIDELIDLQINNVLHNKKFYEMEQTWRALEDLVKNTNFKANIQVDLLDVTKAELAEDFETNAIDVSKSALFDQVYIKEYDQYGGYPFSSMIGLYEFENTPDDIDWLTTMGKIANAAHAPFIAAASPKFFGFETAAELGEVKDLTGRLQHPRYGRWNRFRDTEAAAYVGLTFPRYILRLPYHPDSNPCRTVNFTEDVRLDPEGEVADRNHDGYLWGNAAILMARNMARSFETSGWCQYIRGPKGGGLIRGLPVHTFEEGGQEEIKVPIEITIPDYRELEFATGGFIPLIYKKGTADAAFFSSQSAKISKRFKDPKDSENSQLVTNMAYTFSITRIAHYVKIIMRENIGSSAEETYIHRILDNWLMSKVTTIQDPDRLTLRAYPFKAAEVTVIKREGQIGHYDCVISVLPHIQFEGLDVELRLESRLG